MLNGNKIKGPKKQRKKIAFCMSLLMGFIAFIYSASGKFFKPGLTAILNENNRPEVSDMQTANIKRIKRNLFIASAF